MNQVLKIANFDTVDWLELRNKKLMEWLQDESAVEFFKILGVSTELFDDLFDKDRELTEMQIFNLITSLWVDLPLNAFWNEHKYFLMPVLLMSINAWLDANKLEDGTETDKAYSYVFRNLTLQAIPMAVYVLHGKERMREVSLDVHRFFTEHETFEQYKGAK